MRDGKRKKDKLEVGVNSRRIETNDRPDQEREEFICPTCGSVVRNRVDKLENRRRCFHHHLQLFCWDRLCVKRCVELQNVLPVFVVLFISDRPDRVEDVKRWITFDHTVIHSFNQSVAFLQQTKGREGKAERTH